MHVSNRQRHILELLLNRNEEMTAGEIAREIQVSSRTVHRELPGLEPFVVPYGVSLHKKSGFGIQLQGEPQQLEALRRSLSIPNVMPADYSTDERKVLITCQLLASDEPTKLFALAHDLRVAVPTVTADLDQVEEWIGKYGLTLVRRRGFGVQLEGTEQAKRKTIYRMAKNHLDDSAIFGHAADLPPPSAVTSKLLGMVGKENLMKVEQALWGLEEQGLSELSESAYTELLLRLSIAVTRIRYGHEIAAEPSGCPAVPPDEPGPAAAAKYADPLLLHVCKALELSVSAAEAAYLTELLRGGKDAPGSGLLPQDDLGLMEAVRRLIQAMEELTGVPLHEDRSLRDGLLNHIEPVLERIREGVSIRNPLLSQIQKNYELLFRWVRQAVDETFRHLAIPDEEIGFLVMHFGAALERLKQLSRSVRAIIVCTSGIGSSKLLAVRLGKEMPQIEIIEHVSWYEASRIPKEAYDLIISTVDLPLEAGPYIKLSPLLTKEEIDRLRQYVQNMTLDRSSKLRPEPPLEAQAWQRLLQLKAYMDEIVSLIGQFQVFELPAVQASGKDSATVLRLTLQRICETINIEGTISQTEQVVQKLLEREKHGTQVIPDTRLALFHTRSEAIRKPMLSTFRLSEPLILDPEEPAGVTQIVLMLGPLELSKESLEVLSEISALLLLPELILTLEQGSTHDIQQFLSKELLAFYINQMETGRIN